MSRKSARNVLLQATGSVTLNGAHELRSYAIIGNGTDGVKIEWHDGSVADANLVWQDELVGADRVKTKSFPSQPRERPFALSSLICTITEDAGVGAKVVFYTAPGE